MSIDRLRQAVAEAERMFYRLVLVVGGPGSGKTARLRELERILGVPYVNLNLTLSQRLLDVSPDRRPLKVQELCEDIVRIAGSSVVLLDNTELLFSAPLKVKVLPLLQRLARNYTLVASWRGSFDGQGLTYAMPSHVDHQHYQEVDAIIVTVVDPTSASAGSPR